MNRNKKIYLIILTVFLIIAVSASTYAFLQPGWRRYAEFDLGTTTGGTGTFTAYSTGNIEMKIEDAWMAKNLVSGTAMVEDNASVTVQMDGGTSSETWTCTYDLIWVWDSEDKFTEPDVPLPYTHTDGTVYPFEFSIKVGNDSEKDLSSFTWNNGRTILQTRTLSVEKNEHSEMTIPIVTKMYNIPVIQNKFSEKLYRGHVIVSEPRCSQTPTILAVADTGTFLSDAIKKFYTKDGENGLYYGDEKGDYINSSYELADSNYRYSGANPNNYLCFGSEEEICPEDNLYRIIYSNSSGTKVIKNSSIGNYQWSSTLDNSLGESSLLTYLNGEWLNSLGDSARLISDTTWGLRSGINEINLTPKEINKLETGTFDKKIILMRVYEYGLAADPENWNKTLSNYNGKEKNWLYNSVESEWTITRYSSDSKSTYAISKFGSPEFAEVTTDFAVRPVFMLKSTVFYTGGNGTKYDPIRIDNNSFSNHIIAKYTADGENDMYYHDGQGTYENANLEAGDKSYRYSGTNPNNYVCFSGTDCADANNLYRIIGVFGNQTKLIKMEPASYKAWNSSGNNTFANSTIDKYLNEEWINTLGSKSNLIADTTWHVGGVSQDNTRAAKGFYDLEKADTTTVTRKVGLVYPSEYGYASVPTYWSRELWNYEPTKELNWLNLSYKNQCTISRNSGDSYVFYITTYSYLSYSGSVTSTYIIRPTFALKATVRYISGDGSYDNPYVIG